MYIYYVQRKYFSEMKKLPSYLPPSLFHTVLRPNLDRQNLDTTKPRHDKTQTATKPRHDQTQTRPNLDSDKTQTATKPRQNFLMSSCVRGGREGGPNFVPKAVRPAVSEIECGTFKLIVQIMPWKYPIYRVQLILIYR